MRSANFLALAGAVALALLASVSCGGGGGHAARTVAPQASATEPPFYATPMPISQDDALWDWIAANSPEVEPVLRPTYLPFNPTLMSAPVLGQERGCVLFGIQYSDSTGKSNVLIGGGPWFNPPMPGPDTVVEQAEVRGTTGGYQLQDAAEPSGLAFITWNEPGRWGKPDSQWHRDYVEYLISAEGFPKEELLKVANSLQPVTQ